MVMIRPHIRMLAFLALEFEYIFKRRIKLIKKLCLSILMSIISYYLLLLTLDFIGLKNVNNLSQFLEYIEYRERVTYTGGSSVNLSSMPIFLKLFTYLFRPLPFEAHNIWAFFSSLDNLVLLIMFSLLLIRTIKIKSIHKNYKNFSFFILYFSLSTWIILSMITSNLGIANRQKWMFVPSMFFFLFCKNFGRKNYEVSPNFWT